MLLLVLLMLQLDGAAGSCPDFEDGCSRYFNQSFPLPNLFFFIPPVHLSVVPPCHTFSSPSASRVFSVLTVSTTCRVPHPTLLLFPCKNYFSIPPPFFFLNTFLPPARSGISFERRRSMSVCPVSPAAVARRTTQASELHAPTFTPSASAF